MGKRLNAYHLMWLFVFFDLPTHTKDQRKAASKFRNSLLKDGFSMMQFSVYVRHCASREVVSVHEGRVRTFLPDKGEVSMMQITDKQHSMMKNYWGTSTVKPKEKPRPQLQLF